MPTVRSVKYSIGNEGGTPGTPVARTAVLPIRDIGDLDRALKKETDPVIVGTGMKAGDYVASADVGGKIPLSPRSCPGWGMVLKGIIGGEATPAQIVGIIRIRYTGTSDSLKLTTDLSGKTINAKKGVLGAEANDSAFGTAGTIDLSNASFDTLAEVVAVIDGYTDYDAKLVTGIGANSIVSVVSGIFQAKGKWAFLVLTGAASGAYAHRFTPDLTVGSERATFSIQKDGFQDNYLYAGNGFPSLSMSAALKAAMEADVDVLGMTETAGQTASALALGDSKPFIFAYGITAIGGVDYNFCRKNSLKLDVGALAEGYGQASLDRAYHQKGTFAVSGDLTLRHDSVSHLERAKIEAGTPAPITLVYFAAESKKIGLGVAEMMIIEIPYAKIQSFKDEKNGDALDAAVTFEGFYPSATCYEPPLVVTLISADVAVY